MLCPYCKKEIEDDSLFCSFCGETIEQKKLCVNCSEELYPQIATPDAEKKIIDNNLENDKSAKKNSCGKFSTSLLTIISASLAIITIIIIIIFAVKTNVSTPAPARIEYEAETGSNNSFAADGEQSPDTSSITENDTRDEPLYVVKTADGQETENYDLAFTFEEYLATLNRVCAEVYQGQMPPFTYYRNCNYEAFLFANFAFADYQSVFRVQNREQFLQDVFGVKPHGIWGSDPENGNSIVLHSISNKPEKYTKTLNEFYPMIDELLDTSKTKIIVGQLASTITKQVDSSQIENYEALANINIYVFVDACTGFVKAISCYTRDNNADFTESELDQFIKNGTTLINTMQLGPVLELINRKLENQNLSAESAEKEQLSVEQTIIHGCNYYCACNFAEQYFEFEEYNENVSLAERTVSSTIWFGANNQLANSSSQTPVEALPAPSADKNLSVSLTQEQQTEWMLQIKALAYAAYDNMQGAGKATPEMLLANPYALRMYIYASTDYLFYDAWRKYDWEEEKRLTALEDAFGAGCIADDYEAYIPESAIKDKLRNMFGSAAVEGFNFAGIFDNGFFHYEEGDPGDYLALSECEKTNWNDMSQIVFSYEYGYIEEDPDETLGNIVISTQADTTSPYGCVVKQIEWSK